MGVNRSKAECPRFWKIWRKAGAVGPWPYGRTASGHRCPPPCDHEVFELGNPILAITGASEQVEKWVRSVAKKAEARVDWHYSGGIAQVLHLGDDVSLLRVRQAVVRLESSLKGEIIQRYLPGEVGLHRKGVTEPPKGAIGSFMGAGGNAAYLIAQ